MHLIVGLGNPGPKYKLTRHNVGFLVVDVLLQHFGAPRTTDQFKCEIAKVKLDDHDVILAKPQTFMNLSGEAVQPLLAYYKIPNENMLVIHDDIDLAFGKIKVQKKRGHGGQNGVRNIHEKLGTDDYARLKMGIGRPVNPNIPVVDYVLQNWSTEQERLLGDFVGTAGEAVLSFIDNGFQRTQNEFNTQDEAK